MTYTSDIPQSGETLGGTRARINTNFQNIATVMAINHVAFNETDQGKHAYLQMPESGTDFNNNTTPPSTNADEGAFYAKAANSVTTLFYRSESNGQEYQLTSVDDANIATFGSSSQGWTFLPGGLVLQYGIVTAPGTSGQVTFDRTFSAAPYSIVITSQSGSVGNESRVSNSTPPTTSTFNYVAPGGVNFLNWIAIGPE